MTLIDTTIITIGASIHEDGNREMLGARWRPARSVLACAPDAADSRWNRQRRVDAAGVLAREESKGDVVGFYHTHPAGPPEPSQRDVRTMRAWVSSFGKPLLCLIESDGELAAYRFSDAVGFRDSRH
jgi:proteasome lid subunit RPN8/RPN11